MEPEAASRPASPPANPYVDLPSRQLWSRGVARGFDPASLGNFARPLIRRGDRIVSAGSCFAANLVPYLEAAGFDYLRTEFQSLIYRYIPEEAMSYAKFSAAYGNIYTARQLHQLLLRCLGEFRPAEDRWVTPDAVIDPFRPGLRYKARSEHEFDLLTSGHLAATLEAFRTCDVFIFTLGLTEGWMSAVDGAVFPACPGTVAGTFDPERHRFVNFDVADVAADLEAFVVALRAINPKVRFVFTVSPVPLIATASGQHVLEANTYSKSVLRVAAEMVCRRLPDVSYFPAYEIVTGPQASEDFFESDRRNVSRKAVETVMEAFLRACDTGQERPMVVVKRRKLTSELLSARIAEAECEEVAQVQAVDR